MAGNTYILNNSVAFRNVDGSFGKDGEGQLRLYGEDSIQTTPLLGISSVVFTVEQPDSLRFRLRMLSLFSKPSDPMDGVVSSDSSINSVVATWDNSIQKLRVYFSQSIASWSGVLGQLVITSPVGFPAISVTNVTIDGNNLILSLSNSPTTNTYTIDIADDTVTATAGTKNKASTLNFSGVDLISPTVADFQPPPETTIGPQDKIYFSVTDDTRIGQVLVAINYAALERMDVAHDGVQFCSGYTGSVTPIAGGLRYEIFRVGGWLAAPTIRIFAVDAAGNELG